MQTTCIILDAEDVKAELIHPLTTNPFCFKKPKKVL